MAIKKNKPVEEVVEKKEEIVEEVKEEKAPVKKDKKKIYVVNTLLNFRESASKTSNVLKVLSVGDEIEVNKIDGEWAECNVGKIKGYVMAQYITLK